MASSSRLLSDPAVLALLDPDDPPRAAVRVSAALSGAEQITPAVTAVEAPAEPLSGPGKVGGVVIAAAAAAIAPTGWSGGDLPLRMLGGYSVVGGSGSVAVRVHQLLRDGSTLQYVVVTDRWLAFCDSELGGGRQDFVLRGSVPRGDVVAAQRRGRLGARGRVELYFADGSMAAMMTGAMSTGPAEELLGALGLPSQPPG